MRKSDFEETVNPRAPDAYVAHLRRRASEEAARLNPAMRSKVDDHLAVYQAAVDELARTHAHLIDHTDLDLGARTRSVAVWELAGRAISLAHALLDQLRQGYAAQTVGTTRLMYEAVTLLEAVIEAPEQTVRKWLDGGHLPMRDVRKHQVAFAERSAREAAEAGAALEDDPRYLFVVESLKGMPEYREFIARRATGGASTEGIATIVEYLSRGEYGQLSHERGGHNDRVGLSMARDMRLRQFVYGPHPDARVLAAQVDQAGHDIQRVIIIAGYCFARFFLGNVFQTTSTAMQQSFDEVRRRTPLS